MPAQIHFRDYDEDTDVVFEIKGIGMSTEVEFKFFSLFFSSKSPQGTGIGLFITRKIIHQHDVRVTVISQPGEGMLFRVTIPGSLIESIRAPGVPDMLSGS